MKPKLFKLIVPFVTLIVCILFLEIGLSFFYGKNDSYYIWKPHLEYSFGLDDTTLRDVSKNARSIYSSIGARSEEVLNRNLYKIVVFGGSTTECAALDQRKTWPHLLQTSLNGNHRDTQFWVGNFGKSGKETNHHILQTKEILDNPQLKDAKLVLYLVGFNDLMKTLQNTDKYVRNDPEELRRSAFMVVPDKDLPFHRRTAIWKFLKHMRHVYRLHKYDKEELAELYQEIRKKRMEAEKVDIMPDLERGLDHYKKNLDSLISLCRAKGKTPVLITQPVLWRPDITNDSEKVLYTLFDNRENLETQTLYKCMQKFNNALIEVSLKHNVTYIDLSNPSKESWFYDDCHFNQKGAEEVSKIILNGLKPLLDEN